MKVLISNRFSIDVLPILLTLFFFFLLEDFEVNAQLKSKKFEKTEKTNPFSITRKKKLSCFKDELKTKNCFLSLAFQKFSYTIFITGEKIRFNNGIWRSLSNMPKHGQEVDWNSIQIIKIGQRLLIEFLLWGIKNHGQVQSLYWDVYEIQGVKISLVLSEIIQKRRKNITEWKEEKYLHDKREKFGLQKEEDKIRWFVKDRTGYF